MWDWSPEARADLNGGHTAVSRVDVLHAGRPTYQLEVVSGSASVDADRPVRANLACTLFDPTGALSRGDLDDLLDPYECEIAPWRGVRLSSTSLGVRTFRDELAPLGVFGLTSRQVSDGEDGLTISLSGQDRAMGYQVPMSSALAIPGGTPVEEAIIRLLAAVNPAVNVASMSTGRTCGPLLYAPDIDVWAKALELAESVGARLYHDRTGQCVLAPTAPVSRIPVAAYNQGGGLLLDLDRAEDADTVRNVVVAESPDGLVRAVVEDDDPTSPTFAGGRYLRRPISFTNQHFSSVQQAEQAAAARLAYELGRSETVNLSIVPDPGLDEWDVVSIHRPRAGLTHRNVVVANFDVPLGSDQTMPVGCRKSVLTRDGAVLEERGDEL